MSIKTLMHHYHVKREERHFGFLFLSALISNAAIREEMFALSGQQGVGRISIKGLIDRIQIAFPAQKHSELS